jgi:hypothetical protein
MAQYAMLLYAPLGDADEEGSAEGRAEHDRHSEDLQRNGTMIAAFVLEHPSTATSLRGGDVMTDGPFLESKEVVLGFGIIEAPDLDAALEIARTNPILHQGGGIELRPVEGYVIPARPTH